MAFQPSGETVEEATSGSGTDSDGGEECESEKGLIGRILTAERPWGNSEMWNAIIQNGERELENRIIYHQKRNIAKDSETRRPSSRKGNLSNRHK